MKKLVISSLLISYLAVALFAGKLNIVSAKTSNKTVHKKYEITLKKLKTQLKKKKYYQNQGLIYFKYCDFDKDGIDECIVQEYSTVIN